jgi:hypothetical protein
MGTDENAVTLYYRDGRVETLDRTAKSDIARQIIARTAELLTARAEQPA